MTTTDLAAALLRDVRRYTIRPYVDDLPCLLEKDVLAALTAALDGVDERAVALTKVGYGYDLTDDDKAAITALLAQNAALRAERDRYLRHLTAGAESLNAYKARAEAAEAQIAALTARVEGLTGAVKGLVEILDQHETKGPLPDVALMFCWLAAQEVRAVMRKDGGQ